jgi:fumarate reductase subunit C
MQNSPLSAKFDSLTADKLSIWLARIAAAATSVLLGAFLVYALYFGKNGLSSNHEHWGQFGDFIGGIANPIISFFGLVAVLLTVVLQSKQFETTKEELQHTRRNASEQIEHLKHEARKTEIYRTIQVLENRLERLYREPIYFVMDGKLKNWELYLLMSHATPRVLKCIPPLVGPEPEQYEAEFLQTKATLTQLHITLVKFSFLLTSLVDIDGSEETTFFYEPTLAHLAKQLKEIGYLPASDDQSIRLSQEFRNRVRQNRNTTS